MPILLACVQSSQFSKLEKADILELTVKHLRALQRQQAAGVMTQDPNVVSKYRAGFNECAKEVVRYMGSVREVNEDIKDRVLGHLAGCLQVVNHVTPVESLQQQQQQQQQMKPLHVHIPGAQQPISAGGVTTVAPSVIMPNPQTSLHSGVYFTPSPLRSSASPDCQTPSPVSATPLSSLPMQVIPSSVTTAATTVVSHNPAQISGAFKIVPSSACPGGAVALYLGGANVQRADTVSVDAVPLYSVSLPQQQQPEGTVTAFVPPPLPPPSTHCSSSSSPPSSLPHHQMMDSRLSANASPVKTEYPTNIASAPVDLRQIRKVKSSFVDSEVHHHHHHQQQQHHHHVSFGQCSPASMADEKLWRPW